MTLEQQAPPDAETVRRGKILVRRVIHSGWICVLVSALFLYLSKAVGPGEAGDDQVLFAIYLMIARLAGMCSFAIGGVAIYNHRWTEGILMMLSSVLLPILAFLVHGTF